MNRIYTKKLIVQETSLAPFLVLFLAPIVCAAFGTKPEDISGQLKINRWTLFNSTDEQIRIDTAIEMLKNSDAGARQIVLDALAATDNAAAQSSACKAISTFRNSPQLIPNRNDFIGPLTDILKGPNVEVANLAAQASLIYTYRELKGRFESLVKDSDLPAAAKRNVVYAIQVRPEKEAALLLIDLLDSNDNTVALSAADALARWLPDTDKQQWQKMRRDIERGRIDIVRQRLLTQQDRIRQLNEEILKWQRRYLVSLDSIYQATADDAVRAKFIADNLAFEQSSVKLWAIEKINMWQKSGKPLPAAVFQKAIISLVFDPEPAVRLAAARQLGLLTNINSADALLSQLKVETNNDIKTEILISLGQICNFALSPGAELEINPQVRIETLQIAAEFFKDNNPIAAAAVFRNLLLQNGLEDSQVKSYFEFIAADYGKASDTQTKARLLNEMARLCGNDSFYRAVAGEVFKSVFLSAIDDESEQIASPAVTGLMRIDQSGAFEILKQKGFTGHSHAKICDELISAAAQIGTQQDLEWLGVLAMNTGSEQERQRAADAMMNIFQYCKMEVLLSWAQQLSSQAKSKNDEFLLARTRLLLEAAEKKAEAEQNGDTLISIRRMLAEYYSESSLYGLAAKYYGMLLQTAADPNEKRQLTVSLLDVNLRSGQSESVKQLLANVLLSSDIRPNSEISQVLNDYFTQNMNTQTTKQIFFAVA
ncbi:MAG: HEAT repeat domain-containing protein, partial [Phycisphaerae bacterium]|nr:HEAT repeat domain-containing protein [Phycisphaerae bacterium]